MRDPDHAMVSGTKSVAARTTCRLRPLWPLHRTQTRRRAHAHSLPPRQTQLHTEGLSPPTPSLSFVSSRPASNLSPRYVPGCSPPYPPASPTRQHTTQACFEFGFDHVLPKPLTAVACYKVLRRWLDSRAHRILTAPAVHALADDGDEEFGDDFGGDELGHGAAGYGGLGGLGGEDKGLGSFGGGDDGATTSPGLARDDAVDRTTCTCAAVGASPACSATSGGVGTACRDGSGCCGGGAASGCGEGRGSVGGMAGAGGRGPSCGLGNRSSSFPG